MVAGPLPSKTRACATEPSCFTPDRWSTAPAAPASPLTTAYVVATRMRRKCAAPGCQPSYKHVDADCAKCHRSLPAPSANRSESPNRTPGNHTAKQPYRQIIISPKPKPDPLRNGCRCTDHFGDRCNKQKQPSLPQAISNFHNQTNLTGQKHFCMSTRLCRRNALRPTEE